MTKTVIAPIPNKTLEIIARRYCERMGLDPDDRVRHGADPDAHGFVVDVLLISPRWERVAREIKPMLEVILAFKDVRLGWIPDVPV